MQLVKFVILVCVMLIKTQILDAPPVRHCACFLKFFTARSYAIVLIVARIAKCLHLSRTFRGRCDNSNDRHVEVYPLFTLHMPNFLDPASVIYGSKLDNEQADI